MPAAKGIFFGGRQIIIPGAYAVFDASRLVPNRLSAANTLALIGRSKGGDPGVVHTFNSLQSARQTLREGKAFELFELAYNPSPQVQGAGTTRFVRINQAEQAILNLQESAADAVLLTSIDYGVLTNNIRVKVETASLGAGFGKKITVQDISPNKQVLEVADNLGTMFSILYTGASEDSQLDVVLTGDIATSLTLDTSGEITPVPTDDLTLDLTLLQYNTVNKLIEFINGHPSYTAALVQSADGSLPSSKLDAVVAQATITTPYELEAEIGAIEHWFDRFSQLVVVTRVAAKRVTPDNVAFTHLAGGTEDGGGVVDADRWAAALALLEDAECSIIAADTEDVAIQAMVLAHAEAMSDVKAKRERISVLGGTVGITRAVAIDNALELTSPYTSYTWPGIKTRDKVTGDLVINSPNYTAALVAGMVSGVAPSTSITNKQVRVGGLEVIPSQEDLEALLDGGVTPLEFDRGRGIFKVTQGLTTYLADANVILRKIIGIRVANFIIVELRNTADVFIGQTADKTTIQSLRNALVAKLNLLTRRAGNPNGVLTEGVDDEGEESPAWRNLILDYDGLEVVSVAVDVSPVGEIAYIPITANLIPNRIRIAA